MKPLNLLIYCAFIAAASSSAMSLAAENLNPNSEESRKLAAKSRIYTHPVRGFTIAIPPGGQVLERNKENPQISIRSRKGYMISLQSGPAKPEIPLTEMSKKLEAKYLGKGKPWNHKGKQKHKQVGGLPAIEGHYEGANTQARVDIIRGARTDHVFIFFAGEQEYPLLIHEYEWMLSHFRPGPDDLIKPRVTLSSNSSIFNKQGFGYSIRYPLEWIHSVPSQMTAMFSGKEGDPAYSAIVSVQNIAPPGANTSKDAADLALSNLMDSLKKSVQKLRYINEQPWKYVGAGHQLPGREIILTYAHAGQDFKKRIIVIPRPDQNIAHIWSYTAPVSIFDTFAETADRMLQSWEIIVSEQS